MVKLILRIKYKYPCRVRANDILEPTYYEGEFNYLNMACMLKFIWETHKYSCEHPPVLEQVLKISLQSTATAGDFFNGGVSLKNLVWYNIKRSK